jgi:thioesterase domain-containing protein
MSPNNNSSLLSAVTLAACISFGCFVFAKANKEPIFWDPLSRRRGLLSPEEKWIESSIRATMPPAHQMGITLESISMEGSHHQRSLSLSMPLRGNTNVHGTAFAGSLYSLSVLCAWYTLVCCLRSQNEADHYNIVVKSAEIQYKRPVQHVDRVIATSFLPSEQVCQSFLKQLKETGKTTIEIVGEIQDANGKAAVQYTALLCGFLKK